MKEGMDHMEVDIEKVRRKETQFSMQFLVSDLETLTMD
jgi:hypothetical protein